MFLNLQNENGIAVLTINRPEALNALNDQVLNELYENFKKIDEDRSVRVLLITGAGEKAFVAGADIKGFDAMTPTQSMVFAEKGQKIFRFLEVLRVPVIACVNGFALGGGFELALACDFIVASQKAKFGLPEVTLGLIPGFGGTQRLARYVGIGRARELTYTGRMVSADEGFQMGFVNRVVAPESLMKTCQEIALEIASRAPVAVTKAKEAINMGTEMPIDEGMHEERNAFAELFRTTDLREGVKAFVEKRKAVFKGE
jgi:enoyl-CoA hydratase